MDPHSLASVVRVVGGESDGSYLLRHYQTMRLPHESYGLFDARISGDVDEEFPDNETDDTSPSDQRQTDTGVSLSFFFTR